MPTFSVTQGTDKEYLLTALDGGAPIDLTGAKLYATAKTANAAESGGSALFRLRNTTAGGNDSQIEVTDGAAGQFKLKFAPSNTVGLTPGYGYVIDVFLETSGGKRYQIVAKDVLEIRTAVTTDFSA
jgi:hypothetical protein